MRYDLSAITLLVVFIALSGFNIYRMLSRGKQLWSSNLVYSWIFFLGFVVAEFYSFSVGIWVLAVLSFIALREYFSLIDIRLQDRWGILGAYLSIPFMFYFIQIDWYGMFIISIPVYAFLTAPLLVTLGGRETAGTVFSVGAIDFGLFLFVYCIGHVGYLLLYETWMPVLLVLSIGICDLTTRILHNRMISGWLGLGGRLFIPMLFTILLSRLLSPWTGIPSTHSVILGAMLPILAVMGQHTGDFLKADLGVEEDFLFAGKGQILDNLKSFFFTAPVMFHYIRYFLK